MIGKFMKKLTRSKPVAKKAPPRANSQPAPEPKTPRQEVSKPLSNKALTAEGWKRLMMKKYQGKPSK